MAEHDSDRAWDEYEWERFLQQQDQKTEKYMELLEKYIDDPQRDEIVAREMGWCHLNEDSGDDWSDDAESFVEDAAGEDSVGDPISGCAESFEQHVLYRAAFSLTIWIDRLFESKAALQNDPAAVKLATHCALASAKLAAALSDEEAEELGMTIAYLKRSLKAITVALDASAQLISGEIHHAGAAFRPATTDLPGPRRHHPVDGRIPRRMAAPLRQPLAVE